MGMQARIELTILHHNTDNTERKHAAMKKDSSDLLNMFSQLVYLFAGDKRYNIVFPKGRKQWVARPLLEDKNYHNLVTMMDDVIQLRQHNDDRQDIQEYSMPDSIPKNIHSSKLMKQTVKRYCHSRMKILEAQNEDRDTGFHYKSTGARHIFASIGHIPYTAKLSRGETFAVVHKTHYSLENFRGASGPCHYVLYTANDSRGKLSRLAKKPRKPRKFSPSEVLPYTV